MKRSTNNRKKQQKRGQKSDTIAIFKPIPVVQTGKLLTHTQRYIALSAATVTFSGKALLNWIMMAVTATTSYRCFNSFKIRMIEIWSPVSISTDLTGIGAIPQSITFEWYGPVSGYMNSNKFIAEPTGTRPAYIRAIPPKLSSADFWLQSGSTYTDTTDTMFAILGPKGTIVDMTFSAVLVDDETAFGAEAPVAASAGVVYYNYLDGRASGVYSPAGMRVVPGPSISLICSTLSLKREDYEKLSAEEQASCERQACLLLERHS
jgi:hypothetical protein